MGQLPGRPTTAPPWLRNAKPLDLRPFCHVPDVALDQRNHAIVPAMATVEHATDLDPVLAAIARSPRGAPFTPEQRAELDHAMEEIAAGRARLVRNEDVPAVLEELHRQERGD